MDKRENILIKNEAGKPLILDFNAEIGEDLFSMMFGSGEGITIKSITEKLKSDFQDIIINISSTGGDLKQALAIHDYISLQNKPVTVNINGFAASAATVFNDLGTVNMPDSAMLLVHNASTRIGGNANDLREGAEMLDKWDERMARIYQNKTQITGKKKKMSEIYDLMERDTWITAKEALDFGLIDNIVKGQKIAAYKETIDKINNSVLPKINNMNKFEKIWNSIKTEFKKVTDEIFAKANDDEQMQHISDVVSEISNKNSELNTKYSEMETKYNSEVEKVENMTKEFETLKSEKTTIENKVTESEAKIVEITNKVTAKEAEIKEYSDLKTELSVKDAIELKALITSTGKIDTKNVSQFHTSKDTSDVDDGVLKYKNSKIKK